MKDTKGFQIFVSLSSELESLMKQNSEVRVTMTVCVSIPSDEADECEFKSQHNQGEDCDFCMSTLDSRVYQLTSEDCVKGVLIKPFSLCLEEGFTPRYSLFLSCYIETDKLFFLAKAQNYSPLFRHFDGEDFQIDLIGESMTWEKMISKYSDIV